MPLKKCSNENKSGWKWGDSGKCFIGPDGKKKAIKQGIAIEGPKKFSEMASEHEWEIQESEIEYVLECVYEAGANFAEGSCISIALLSNNGWTEEITEDNFIVPDSQDYYEGYEGDDVEEWDIAANRPGLWENIRRKKMREGDNYKPAKTEKEGRPSPEELKKAQSKELQKDVYDNPGEAMKRAKQLGLDEIHDHPSKKDPDKKVFMPGKTHDEYEKALREEMSKAIVESYADHAEALQRGKPGPNDPRKTPAPKKDQKKGSKKNKPDSAKDDKGKITFSKETIAKLSKAVREHNAKGKGSKATLGQLKAVYRRGAGAFSTSHAPKMSRDGWAMARVRAYLYLLRNGRPSNPNYKQDNDLLPSSHPRSSKASAGAGRMEDYIFISKEKAMEMAKKLGMKGVHSSKTADGKVFYFPGATEREFFDWYRKNDGVDAAMTEKQKEALDKDKDGKITKKDFELLSKSKGAEYKGRKVTLNKPFRTPDGPKKSAVYTKNEKGNVVLVRFGDPNMKIKKSNPERRKSFRARHGCDKPGIKKWTAKYWSCRAW